MKNKTVVSFIQFIISFIATCYLILVSLLIRKKRKVVVFGSAPIIDYKYWTEALRSKGIPAKSLMKGLYSINSANDFDLFFDDLIPFKSRLKLINEIQYLFFVWPYIIANAKYVVTNFNGFVFKRFFWKTEHVLFKLNRIKVIHLAYGSDAFIYSKICDKSVQNVLLNDYIDSAYQEFHIQRKLNFWNKFSDIILPGFMLADGFSRWSITTHKFSVINLNQWQKKKNYSSANGSNDFVKIIHSPNHRSVKGTEFIIDAIEQLKSEGYNIHFKLLENLSNEKVKEELLDSDILVEQLILPGYGTSGIEGLASGLTVMSNLENEHYTKLFRRYSYLNECPIVSTNPENIKMNLIGLIQNPKLREQLGNCGRQYAEKYHSYDAAHYMFSNIFKYLEGEPIDLMNLYHPLKSEYVKNNSIKTPLINNKYIHNDN